ncbi:hypothetical protein API480_51 [Paenibacillus phage vB_PlaP_API480]|uniref:Uncharacterized protein n=1 Tax=Paenibacillus larvae subsp. larvae TaxID=147375 RepID=A0A6C0QZP3_9BACL|nr:hypothetical protein [Paenibacillus larvae]QBX06392.1 hypothetical protein API480_51 [Paenibacillus phage vB_PlaP_API480]QHZ54050.1 hypothetical protein ERICV_05066 [Paenibacillus larvae subsp. larvae]
MNHEPVIIALEEQVSKLQSELKQERHLAEGLSKVNEVLARKYRAEKARADAMEKFLKEEDVKDVKCDS